MSSDIIEITWDMFDIVSTLGEGTFGKVYKVKCLTSTKYIDGKGRVLLDKKQVKESKDNFKRNRSYS